MSQWSLRVWRSCCCLSDSACPTFPPDARRALIRWKRSDTSELTVAPNREAAPRGPQGPRPTRDEVARPTGAKSHRRRRRRPLTCGGLVRPAGRGRAARAGLLGLTNRLFRVRLVDETRFEQFLGRVLHFGQIQIVRRIERRQPCAIERLARSHQTTVPFTGRSNGGTADVVTGVLRDRRGDRSQPDSAARKTEIVAQDLPTWARRCTAARATPACVDGRG